MAAQSVMAAHTPIADPTPWTAIVTGGASGIGAATARKLASRGINILIADVADETGQQLAGEIQAEFNVDAFNRPVDVSKETDIEEMIKAIVQKWGRLDYAANVAGICKDGGDMKDDESKVPTELIDRTYEVNQRGIQLCQKHEAQQMLKQEPRGVTISPSPPKPVRPQRGSIVNVGSTASLTGLGHAAYTPTKHAILGITKNGAYYYGPHGVRCNSVAPGGTVTPLGIDAMPEGIKELVRENDPAVGKGTPMGKLAWPEEVANVISFLLSDEASHVCAVNIEVDGGFANTRI
ncbi:Short-chain dehydrogenase [Fulvia fulva]|nr:Short-chain dehydrogenase [Fulvia fulva]